MAVAVVTLGLTVFASTGNARPQLPMTICKGQPVPPGWVIVGEVSELSCPGFDPTRPNAYVIRKL
jgi:hypothetical protein